VYTRRLFHVCLVDWAALDALIDSPGLGYKEMARAYILQISEC